MIRDQYSGKCGRAVGRLMEHALVLTLPHPHATHVFASLLNGLNVSTFPIRCSNNHQTEPFLVHHFSNINGLNTHKNTQKHIKTHKNTQKHTKTHKNTQKHTKTHTHTHTHTHKDTYTH